MHCVIIIDYWTQLLINNHNSHKNSDGTHSLAPDPYKVLTMLVDYKWQPTLEYNIRFQSFVRYLLMVLLLLFNSVYTHISHFTLFAPATNTIVLPK